MKIAVLGAGINGVTNALRIKETYRDSDVTLFSNKFSPETTGDGSGGLWYPYLIGSTPEPLLAKWSIETYEYIHGLWLEGGHDVSVTPIYILYTGPYEPKRSEWTKHAFGYRELNDEQLERLNRMSPTKFISVQTFTTFVLIPATISSNFLKKFVSIGGFVRDVKILSLTDPVLDDYDIVVNCVGLGAREMVPDLSVYSIRGQIIRVIAPWQCYVMMDETNGNYIIPNTHGCVLGGTHQENDYNTSPDDGDSEFIIEGCSQMAPSLRKAERVREWVGLRPGRHQVRLEPEERGGKLFIHNYGHGGSGLTLFWGCASDVLQILDDRVKRPQISKL